MALGDESPAHEAAKVWDARVGELTFRGLQVGRSAVEEERSAESGARGHSAAGDVGCVCADAESRREGLPVAEDSAFDGGREVGWGKRVYAWTRAC